MKVAIIILNWNGQKDTLECLQTLENSPAEIVVIDNGSTDGSEEAIRAAYPLLTLLQTGENLGYAGGNNVGIEHAFTNGCDAVIVMNNDVHVSHNLVEGFLKWHARYPQAILGGNTYLMSDKERHDAVGGKWNEREGNFDLVFDAQEGESLDYVTGCCFFMPRVVYEAIGGFEPRYFLYWEDADLCVRARRAGFQVRFCPDAMLWHKGSASMVGGGPHHAYFWWRGRLLFIHRNSNHSLALYLRVIFPAIARMHKHYMLKLFQSLVYKIRGKSVGEKRDLALRKYRASFQGINDYFWGKFGNAPAYIFSRD